MTYCVGMMLDQGLVFMSDTRTNAGLDNISTFRKMHIWEDSGERVITLLSAGNLATTQSVISLLDERSKAPECRSPTVLAAESMFQVAQIIAGTLQEVIQQRTEVGQSSEKSFDATMILGGQIRGGTTRLFLIYPEGNFIEAGADTPFFQIGEIKYGRPILVRAYHPTLDFSAALKLMLVSFDSTLRANLTVGPPFDYHCYEADTFTRGPCGRVESDDPRFLTISEGWSDALKRALEELPSF
ncbi:MAG: peptidase [Aestuariivita sp.]|nr:peptidase [Aestuariivita sp.]MCY4203461.1 peptidase [Aestuariivita sp.]MCY4288502.1 peptidase [Aestuariivita sp.]MCY4347086.1 peptidase [Aestuariivita sp.]